MILPCFAELAGLLGEDDGLHAGNLKAFAAAHILAGHQIVFAQHVGAGFGEAGAIALIGATRQLSLLGADNPGHFVFGGLMAMRTIERGHLSFWPFIEKVAFFHGQFILSFQLLQLCRIQAMARWV
jgi:hypothetical protein